MARKHILRKISGAVAVGVLAAAAIVPVQAAVARANSVRYFNAYRVYNGTASAAQTQGGSAYDDRGYGLNAYLVAGVKTTTGDESYGYRRFIGYTDDMAESGFRNNVIEYVHDCKVGTP